MNNLFKKLSDNIKIIYIVCLAVLVLYEVCTIAYFASENYSPDSYVRRIIEMILYCILFGCGIYAEGNKEKEEKLGKIILGFITVYTLFRGYITFGGVVSSFSGYSTLLVITTLISIFVTLVFFAFVLLVFYSYYKEDAKYNQVILLLGVVAFCLDVLYVLFEFILISEEYAWINGFGAIFSLSLLGLCIVGSYKLFLCKETNVETTQQIEEEKTEE